MNIITIGNSLTTEELDNLAVDVMANAMKKKLAKKRAEGRGGWAVDETSNLSRLLHESVEKGDPVDIANFAAFLLAHGARVAKGINKSSPFVAIDGATYITNEAMAKGTAVSTSAAMRVEVKNGGFWVGKRRVHRDSYKLGGLVPYYVIPDVNSVSTGKASTTGTVYFANNNMEVQFALETTAQVEHGYLSMDYSADGMVRG